jgi:hypothetical protein
MFAFVFYDTVNLIYATKTWGTFWIVIDLAQVLFCYQCLRLELQFFLHSRRKYSALSEIYFGGKFLEDFYHNRASFHLRG